MHAKLPGMLSTSPIIFIHYSTETFSYETAVFKRGTAISSRVFSLDNIRVGKYKNSTGLEFRSVGIGEYSGSNKPFRIQMPISAPEQRLSVFMIVGFLGVVSLHVNVKEEV